MKQAVRNILKSNLGALSEAERAEKSGIIQSKALELIRLLAGIHDLPKPSVCTYAGAAMEVETARIIRELLKEGSVLIPRCNGESLEVCEIGSLNDLSPGAFGIPEPRRDIPAVKPALKPDFILVPGLGFDSHGNRLGRGKGYYDRFLSTLDEGVIKIGLAFNVQILDIVPVDEKDFHMDYVITESRIYSSATGLPCSAGLRGTRSKII